MWLSKPDFLLTLLLFSLILLIPAHSVAFTSVNVPVGNHLYDDLERLEVKGLLKSSMLSTRPISRAEAAWLVSEARALAGDGEDRTVSAILGRLGNELRAELREGGGDTTYLKPASEVRFEYLYSDGRPHFASINNHGDELSEGNNLRAGFALEGGFFGLLSYYASPEWRLGDDYEDAELLHGYVKLGLGPLEVLAGRDSMWWGPGGHGALLLSNNARPFDMVKITTSRPLLLPWVLRSLGLFRPTFFLTALEEDRFVPKANVLGMRLDFKPAPFFQFGLSRVFMFGGKGRRHLTFSDWVDIFIASDSAEHSDSPTNGNQIVSVDASFVYVNDFGFIPFSGIKLYTEWGAEDSSGNTRSPTGKANIVGAFIDEPLWLKGTDLRVEWANTARNARYGPSWYRHSVYGSGYTFHGRVIGHHMGTDARDLFVRLRHHLSDRFTIGVEGDFEESFVHSTPTERRWGAADITYRSFRGLTIKAMAGYEQAEPPSGPTDGNAVVWFALSHSL